jgi:hypothetical protein
MGNWNSECGIRNAEVREVGNWKAECGRRKGRIEIRKAECGINEDGGGYNGRRKSGFAELNRVEVPSLPLFERHAGFNEVELCFTDEQFKKETHRCLQCDLEICLAKEDADG